MRLKCALYIFAFKLLAPNKFVILKGNHEVRDTQIKYSYKKEYVQKYGDTLGPKIWEITNRVFDKLPLSTVIDNATYCAHGGILTNNQKVENILKTNR
jgi:serine/threonine-protein phosphatase 2B catalytic subunit